MLRVHGVRGVTQQLQVNYRHYITLHIYSLSYDWSRIAGNTKILSGHPASNSFRIRRSSSRPKKKKKTIVLTKKLQVRDGQVVHPVTVSPQPFISAPHMAVVVDGHVLPTTKGH